MSSLLLYSIKSALVQAVLYLPYVLMLRRESFFRFNRLVLLCILLLSLVLPLCNVPGMSLDRQPVVQAAQMQMLELGIPVHVLPEVQVVAEAQATHNLFTFSLFHLLTFIYIIGMVALLVMRLWQVGRLQIGLRRGALWQQEEQGVRIYCHSDDVAPFSWMRNIVISRQDWEEAGREIVLHETGHIRAFHSWDIVLLTLVQMLQWWNPLVYMLGISLRDVHEYEADSYVLGQGVSAQGYQLLLIRKAVGSGSYTFANSFNHSLTKKRIAMMKKSKSNPWMRSKALYVIPVAALALCAFATPKFVAPIEGAVSKLGGEVTEKSSDLQISEEENEKFSVEAVENVQTILSVAEPSNKQIFVNGRSVSIEELKDLDPEKITSIHVLHGDATKNLLGKEAYYIMTDDPKYANPNAGKLNYNQKTGKYEAIVDKPKEVTQDTVKKIYGTAKPVVQADNKNTPIEVHGTAVPLAPVDTVYDRPAVNAKYPGGDEEFFKFLNQNIRYPKLCHEFGVQGRVLINFVVEKDGSLTEIKKLRGPSLIFSEQASQSYKESHPDSQEQLEVGQDLGDLLYEEAERVLKLMPKWEPAKDKDDNPVRSRFTCPIKFQLN